MSANIIIFEGQYIADQVRNLDKAKQLTEEAMEIIKKANQHRNWKCKETMEISNNLSTISNRVQRLNLGIMRTANVLGRGLRSFTELEQRSDERSARLSENLREQHGFSAQVRGKDEQTKLPVTEIPQRNDSFVEQAIKGFARNTIQIAGAAIGGIIGAVKNGLEGITKGFMDDVKEGVVDKVDNIIISSRSIAAHENIGESVANIAINSLGLIATVGGFGQDFQALKNIKNLPQGARLLSFTTGRATKVTEHILEVASDSDAQINELYYPSSSGEDADKLLLKMVTDTLVPFGLDETLIQGVKGVGEGAKTGGDTGYSIASGICDFLGL